MTLRPFQEGGVTFGVKREGRAGIFMHMGLGKTPVSAKIAAVLGWRRIVVVCKDSGVKVWKGRQGFKSIGEQWLELFTGLKVVTHLVDGEQREYDWNIATPRDEVHVWVVIYNTFALDMGIHSRQSKAKAKKDGRILPPRKKIISTKFSWDGIIADEARRMNNKDSAAWQAIYEFTREHGPKNQPMGFLPLTGTPGDKGPQSFWGYLRILDPKIFKSYWAFIQHFHVVDYDPFGRPQIFDQRQDTKAEWDRVMHKYFYVIKEDDVQGERPPIDRQPFRCTMTDTQRKAYWDLLKHGYHLPGEDIVIAQNPMVKILRLRQILCCPKILSPELDAGGGIEGICDELEDASEQQRHTVIFTPFKEAFPHLTSYLSSRGFKHVYHLHGGITSNQQDERIRAYRDTKGIILCTIQYAEAFSLEPATSFWFLGIEWSPDPNSQAERRVARFLNPDARQQPIVPVLGRFITFGTYVDERITDVVGIKQEKIDYSTPSTFLKLIQEANEVG